MKDALAWLAARTALACLDVACWCERRAAELLREDKPAPTRRTVARLLLVDGHLVRVDAPEGTTWARGGVA